MSFDLLITVIITSIIQSIFGTGVLLFGTPILLILGYNFQYSLSILLPTSILINLFQIKDSIGIIDIQFYKKLLLYSLPLIIISLYFITLNKIEINFFVGVFLLFIAFKNNIKTLDKLLKFILQYESKYLMVLGVFHGVTNLGGALLSGIIFTKNLSKDSKRATIAICYLSMAIIQIITLIVIGNSGLILNKLNFTYWVLGPLIFFIVDRSYYLKINEVEYIKYSNLFLFLIGSILIMKS
tara:strand:+ start:844 stop:1563 length:720 start_codon:yes stop_codon:yes gene_type:complete